MKMKSK